MASLLGIGYHEFDANWVFEYDDGKPRDSGLRPFYAVEAITRESGGAKRTEIEFEGDTYFVQLKYQESGIGSLNHPSSDLDTVREYRILWQRDDDVGQCSGSFHITPRSPDMVTEKGDRIRNAVDLVGVNVRAQGSNLDFRKYLPLFRQCMTSLGISRRYWRGTHLHADQYSNIQDGEVYVRIQDGQGGSLIAVDGALARIANYAADERDGYTKHIRDDRERAGHYHTATIGDGRASELVDRHTFAKETKYYYAKNSTAFDPDHPLAHPKLGVSYQGSKSDRVIYWSDLERFIREIEELLLNILNWDDIPVVADDIADTTPYVENDPYFDPQPSHRNRRLVADPTPELKDEQENIIIRHLTDGLEDSDVDLLEYLALTDGGEVSPKKAADSTDWTLDTIYAAIERLEDIVQHSYGEVELRSHYVAERIAVAVQEARSSTESALASLADDLRQSRARDIVDDALTHWVDQHGVDVQDRRDARLQLRMNAVFDDIDEARVALTRGLYAWLKSGWRREAFLDAEATFELDGRRDSWHVRGLVSNNVHRR